ncbi:DUF4625 domain-containing protein [Tamlana crocina]|uniref:DUF4625 domain-containing protein n=1 Tax=Tamlana crocina TaxID=393006 RepID=A0ABX1D6T4_9FLAO|nr:DUF4625 domain-containing protein [Tamlana crocina]NJX14078.1 DUF4625 domain-containing protein [Tamlana crocina]
MKRFKIYINLMFLAVLFTACSSSDSDEKDLEKPTITVNYDDGFPQGCQELQRGQTYTFKAMVTDNLSLASYSLDLHHNFDHHTHDDQVTLCDLLPIKTAVNPLIYMESFSIDGDLQSYEIAVQVAIPNDVDTGDYHCAFSVTDVTGWQSRTSIDVKIVD